MFAHTDWIACLGRRLSSRTLCNFSHAALSMAGRCAAFTSSLLLARLLPLSTTCRPMDQLSPLPLSPSQSLLLAAMPSDPCAPSSFHPSLAFGPVVLTTQVRRARYLLTNPSHLLRGYSRRPPPSFLPSVQMIEVAFPPFMLSPNFCADNFRTSISWTPIMLRIG